MIRISGSRRSGPGPRQPLPEGSPVSGNPLRARPDAMAQIKAGQGQSLTLRGYRAAGRRTTAHGSLAE